MNLSAKKKPNLESVTESLIKTLKVKVNNATISQALQDHPDYPSMLSIVDCLNDWSIATEVYNIKRAEYDRDDLLFPFIAHVKEEGGRFILIHNIDNNGVKFSDEKRKNAITTEEEFLNRWDGIALRAEKTEKSGEKDYNQNRLKYFFQRLVLPLGLALVLSIFYLGISRISFSWPYLLLSLVKLGALSISILLLMQSINSNNPFIQNLCTFGKKNNCNAILKSDAAKVTSWLSWSEVGFFYFSGSLLLLLVQPASIILLAWLNVLALPYIIYSIGYQYRVKNWCILCCTVQGMLALEFLIATSFDIFTLSLSSLLLSVLYLLPLTFLIPIIAWGFLKQILNNKVEIEGLKFQLNSFKYNKDLFNQALYNQPRYAIPDNIKPIFFGNNEGKDIITIVSDPFCSPCHQTHAIAKAWASEDENIKIKMLFHVAEDKSDPGAEVANYILSLNEKDSILAQNALEDWYSGQIKNFKLLNEKYPASATDQSIAVGKMQKDWCKLADITYTPTVFINGYKIPVPYKIDDLRNLLY
ncbi:cysteine peptidase family C39 domain-containing protein [Pedobacter endophyticus]|uniref:Thioredoxin domain-containing protein n=1 Tax=Pedobacter endophyticus TaxID=2789740 RepID=A0A7S9Q0R2_9SPHI|nr:cysteine peptidase family C39 domain-containing protein [Pedobacter endophyticus]QPH41240.1 thioredoxin domain-containing protein [Pedobacter endophyticus]